MNILIIGAGGVTSYLLPCLIKAFPIKTAYLLDKDILEPRNLDRQLFNEKQVGMYKVDALAALYEKQKGPAIVPVKEWLTSTTEIPVDTDMVICAADNHEARRNAIDLAYRTEVRCYIGGNEYFDAEAYVTESQHKGSKLDPRVRYPAIATSIEGSPVSCQGEAQEIHPQLAIANQRCAAHLLHLIYAWEKVYRDTPLNERGVLAKHLPIEIQSTLTTITCLTETQILSTKK